MFCKPYIPRKLCCWAFLGRKFCSIICLCWGRFAENLGNLRAKLAGNFRKTWRQLCIFPKPKSIIDQKILIQFAGLIFFCSLRLCQTILKWGRQKTRFSIKNFTMNREQLFFCSAVLLAPTAANLCWLVLPLIFIVQ